jgi:hypothetical protein
MVSRWVPLAAAAALALIAGLQVLRPADTETVRSKGAATAQIFVQDARGVHELGGDAVAAGARLMVTLHPAGRKAVSVELIEPGETSVIYRGRAVNGPLPQAFEWTGSQNATLKIVFSDPGLEVIELPLHR